MLYITRKMHFSASHRLHSNKLDDEENLKTYGFCNNPSGHGHNYELEVTVRGEPDPITGMVIDLKRLKDIIQKEIITHVDHKHLNDDVDFSCRQVRYHDNRLVIAILGIVYFF